MYLVTRRKKLIAVVRDRNMAKVRFKWGCLIVPMEPVGAYVLAMNNIFKEAYAHLLADLIKGSSLGLANTKK